MMGCCGILWRLGSITHGYKICCTALSLLICLFCGMVINYIGSLQSEELDKVALSPHTFL